MNVSIDHFASKVAISFDIGLDRDLGFSISVSQEWQGPLIGNEKEVNC